MPTEFYFKIQHF